MVKFKSKTTADIIMLKAHADVVLSVWHKVPNQAGILQVADMPAAIEALRHYAQHHDGQDTDANMVAHDGPGHGNEDGANSQTNMGVHWSTRFAPLIAMVTSAMQAQVDVTWDVS